MAKVVIEVDVDAKGAISGIRQLDSATEGAGKSTDKLKGLMKGLFQGLGIGAGILSFQAITSGALEAADAISELVTRGSQVAQVSAGFQKLVGDSQGVLSATREATQGLISDFDIMQRANQAAQLGLDTTAQGFSRLAETAVVLGQAVGVDATSAFERLVLGIGKGEAELLDELGLVIKAEEAYRNYADAHGLVASKLTTTEKQQALVTAALEKSGAIMAKLGGVQLDLVERFTQGRKALGNLIDQVSKGIATAPGLQGALAGVADALQKAFGIDSQNVAQKTRDLVDDLAESFARMGLASLEAAGMVRDAFNSLVTRTASGILGTENVFKKLTGGLLRGFGPTAELGKGLLAEADAAFRAGDVNEQLGALPNQAIERSKRFLGELIASINEARGRGAELGRTLGGPAAAGIDDFSDAVGIASRALEGNGRLLTQLLSKQKFKTEGALSHALYGESAKDFAMEFGELAESLRRKWPEMFPKREVIEVEQVTIDWNNALQGTALLASAIGGEFGELPQIMANVARSFDEATTTADKFMAIAAGVGQIGGLIGGRGGRALQGAAGGAMTGAAIGSVVPGIGTVAGGIIGGVGGFLGGLFGGGPSEEEIAAQRNAMLDETISKLQSLQSELDKLRFESVSRGADGVRKLFAGLNDEVELSQERFDRLQRIGAASIAQLRAEGLSLVEVMREMRPAIEEALRVAKEQGLELSGTFAELADFSQKVADNEGLVSRAEGLAAVIEAARATGSLTKELFEDIQAEIIATFNELLEKGFTAEQAFHILAPAILQAKEAMKDFGIEGSEAFQQLLADADGVPGLFDGIKDPMERMVELQDLMLQAVTALVQVFGGELPAAVQQYIDSLNRIPTNAPGAPGAPANDNLPPGTTDFAEGGTQYFPPTAGGHLIRVAEAGEGELVSVTPRSKMRGGSAVSVQLGGVNVEVSVHGVNDPNRIAREVSEILENNLDARLTTAIQRVAKKKGAA